MKTINFKDLSKNTEEDKKLFPKILESDFKIIGVDSIWKVFYIKDLLDSLKLKSYLGVDNLNGDVILYLKERKFFYLGKNVSNNNQEGFCFKNEKYEIETIIEKDTL